MAQSPSFFYRYYPINDENKIFIEKIFTHNELYFPSPKKFNDPFDSRNPVSYEGTVAEWEKYIGDRIDKYFPNLTKEQKKIKINELAQKASNSSIFDSFPDSYIDEMGVFCMSEKNDNILMWSHYTDGHKGICLEFKSIANKPFFVIAQKMKYESKYSKPNMLRSSPEETMQAILLTKSKDWKYEKEWRIINHDNGPGVYNFPAELLTSVILGCSIPEENKSLIIDLSLSRSPKPRIYQAKKKKDGFGLDIIEQKL